VKHRSRWLMAAAAIAGVVAWGWWSHRSANAAGPAKPANAVAVDLAAAVRRDVPVYLEGLGNVQAFYTARINSRVDGQLQRVAFTEGQLVRKGEVLAQIDPRPLQAALDQATGTQAKDSAQLQSAKQDLDRYQALAPQNLTSRQVLDSQRALVGQLEAQLQIDRAAISNARTQLEYATIVAPFAGRTGIRLIDPGNIVHAADSTGIVVLTQFQPISVLFTIPEDSILKVTQAMSAGPVAVTALSRDELTPLDSGTLALVDNQIDATTGTVRLKATFANASNTLWPGQFVNVRILLHQRHDAITIPSGAVQRGPAGLFAYVVKPDSTVDARPIETAEETEGVIVVTAGIEAGEQVVTTNQYRLQPGTSVRALPPAVSAQDAPRTPSSRPSRAHASAPTS
jgi:multidrug efflux system membrane fusion protein